MITNYFTHRTNPTLSEEIVIPDWLLNITDRKICNFVICNVYTQGSTIFDLYQIDKFESNTEENRNYLLKNTNLPSGATLLLNIEDIPNINDITKYTYIEVDTNINTTATLDINVSYTSPDPSSIPNTPIGPNYDPAFPSEG